MAVAALSMAACGQRIKYDEAAVEIVEVGTNSGVQEAEIPTGTRYWAPPFSYKYVVKFPTTLQTYKDKCFNFINGDQVQTTQCISLNVRINPADADNIVRIYKGSIAKNGGEDGYVLDDVVNGPILREIQQAFIMNGNKYNSVALYADGGRALLNDVKSTVTPRFSKNGIVIEDVLASSPPTLPDDIVNSIKGALRAKTDAAKADAQLAQTIAEGKKDRATADTTAYVIQTEAAAIRSSPDILRKMEIEKSKGLCPLSAKVCVIGASVAGAYDDN